MSLKAPLAGSRVIGQASATNGFWIALIVSSSDKEAKHRGTKIAGEVDDSYLYGDEEKKCGQQRLSQRRGRRTSRETQRQRRGSV